MNKKRSKILINEVRNIIAEAVKITTPYDADYAKAIKRIKTEIKWDATPKTRKGSAITEIAGQVNGSGLAFIFHMPDISWSPCWNYLGYITGNGTGGTYPDSNKTSNPIDISQQKDSVKLKNDNKGLPTSSKMFIIKMSKQYPVPEQLAKANIKELNDDITKIASGKIKVKEASTTGDVPGYATPKAFSKSGQKGNAATSNAKSIGYKKTKETHNVFKKIWEDSKSNNLNDKLNSAEYVTAMKPLLTQLGTVSHNELAKLLNFIKKTDPQITVGKFRKIVKAVGHESTVGSNRLAGTDAKIKTEIESYFGI